MLFGVLDFRAGAVTDVAADVDDVDFVSHVDFPFVHVVEHFLRFREGSFVHAVPDFLIAGVAEEPDADDDITRKRQPLLGIHELLFEAGAATERDYFIFSYHLSFSILRSAVLPLPVQHVHLYRLLMSEPARARQRYVQ